MAQLRIAYVAQAYPPAVSGAAIVAHRLAEGMARRGHEILVLSASDTGRAYTFSQPNLRLSRMAAVPNPFRVGQRLVLRSLGTIVIELQAFRPHILHSHDVFGMGLTGITAARSLGIPTVVTAHALPSFISAHLLRLPGLRRVATRVVWVYARWFAQRCDRLIAPSRPVARILQENRVPLPEVIGSGVDPHFSPHRTSPAEAIILRRRYALHPTLPIILYVGRLDADKNVRLVVEAATHLLRSHRAQLLIVGDGTRRQALTRLSERLGIAALTRFPGYVSRVGDLPGLFRLASVFVTLCPIETQCLTALEALAVGVPVVSVRTDVMLELVCPGVNGFLVPPGDVNAMAKRLSFLLENPGLAQTMGRTGQAVARFDSIQTTLQRHERLYRAIIGESNGGMAMH